MRIARDGRETRYSLIKAPTRCPSSTSTDLKVDILSSPLTNPSPVKSSHSHPSTVRIFSLVSPLPRTLIKRSVRIHRPTNDNTLSWGARTTCSRYSTLTGEYGYRVKLNSVNLGQ